MDHESRLGGGMWGSVFSGEPSPLTEYWHTLSLLTLQGSGIVLIFLLRELDSGR